MVHSLDSSSCPTSLFCPRIAGRGRGDSARPRLPWRSLAASCGPRGHQGALVVHALDSRSCLTSLSCFYVLASAASPSCSGASASAAASTTTECRSRRCFLYVARPYGACRRRARGSRQGGMASGGGTGSSYSVHARYKRAGSEGSCAAEVGASVRRVAGGEGRAQARGPSDYVA